VLPHRIEQLTGTAQYDHLTKHFTIKTLTGRLGVHPFALTGTVTDFLTSSPRLTGQASFTNGSVTLTGTWLPDRVMIDASELTYGASSLRTKGVVNRLPSQASALAFTGLVDLSDLAQLPWVRASSTFPGTPPNGAFKR
jgi:hypothetical protein